MEDREPAERFTAWQCIGCGKIEAPQECIGVCKDRKVQFVYAENYDELARQLDAGGGNNKEILEVLTRLAWTTPRNGEWERGYRALQAQARRLLHQAGK